MTYIHKIQNILGLKIDVENDLLDLYVLVVLLKGENTTLEDIHDAWAVWKNKTSPEHKSVIPFSELSLEVQELDRKYTNAIIETAKSLPQKQPEKTDCQCEECKIRPHWSDCAVHNEPAESKGECTCFQPEKKN